MAAAPQRQMLTETVYDVVRQRLVDHDIEPGSKLNIQALAQDLDVSPTPLREALARLEADGLVLKRSNAGYTAAPLLTGRAFDELFEMRLLLEPAVCARAAVRLGEPGLDALGEHLEQMRRAAAGGGGKSTLRLFVRHDALFHDRIAEAGDNSLMHDTLRRMHAHTHLYRLYFREGIAEETCREHERILDALRAADPDTSAAAMRTHIRRARERLVPAVTTAAEAP